MLGAAGFCFRGKIVQYNIFALGTQGMQVVDKHIILHPMSPNLSSSLLRETSPEVVTHGGMNR